jgi:hypothetical protein
MKTRSELVVKLFNPATNGQMEPVERFNIGYVGCCAWIQYGSPITLEGIRQLEKTREWDDRVTDLYLDAVENLGVPTGQWIEQLYQTPANQVGGVYSLYLPDALGTVLAIQEVTMKPTFPPRKNSERCEAYIFNPLTGLMYVKARGLTNFDAIFKQTIVELAAEVFVPHDRSLCKDLCWADITQHASFTIKANSNNHNKNIKFK